MRASRQRRLFRQGGYVAVYVIAIILFMTGIVLEGTRNAREQSALARVSSERTAATIRIQAAQQLIKGRLEAHWSQGFLKRASLLELASLQHAELLIDNTRITVSAEDAEVRPDANLLSAEDWQRLLIVYELPPAEAAKLAEQLLHLKNSLPGGRFSRLHELVDFPFLPAAAVTGTSKLPPWHDVLGVGHGSKRLHVRDTPLPIFQALLAAGPEQIGRWKDIRASRSPTVADAELIFGQEARKSCYEGEMQLLRMRITAGISGTEREVLVRIDKGNHLIIELQ